MSNHGNGGEGVVSITRFHVNERKTHDFKVTMETEATGTTNKIFHHGVKLASRSSAQNLFGVRCHVNQKPPKRHRLLVPIHRKHHNKDANKHNKNTCQCRHTPQGQRGRTRGPAAQFLLIRCRWRWGCSDVTTSDKINH